jgi:WD40 repeat protein/serine/threonine protein kinase
MMSDAESKGDVVDQLAEEFIARYRRGERPAMQEYADRYPEHAVQIRDLFPALVALERVAPAGDSESVRPGAAQAEIASSSLPQQVGDYRIVRQIGRGGMGIVYEAEQEALGRRVALKVLHGPAAQDSKLLARFRRESRTAAQLHHTNIVPVFDVGQQGNLCYYAMQFIRGQALDEVFRELQRLRAESKPGSPKDAAAPAGALARSLWTGEYAPAAANGTMDHEPLPTPAVDQIPGPVETTAAALPDHSELSSVASNYQRYCRNVARLGLQVAQALAYAHAHGIIHRDIKPANLLLDTSGVLWVSDFGLVKTQDPALTDTGDLVGTLRYMAPERFRGECDALADVYALGLTLYELLALRPAFDGKDRLHLVEQIGRQEPARLRVLDPRIPRDLETILMKAIEKDPKRRYASADAMAEDLRRYLADEPIKARRIGPLERLGRWGRRNPLVAGLSAAVVLIAAVGFAGVFGQMQVAQANEQQAINNAADANQQRDEAQRQRDEVKALNDKLVAKEQQLQRTLYAAHMNLAKQAWDDGAVPRVLELLEQHRPKPGESDLRNFEWHYLNRLCHADLLLSLKGHPPGSIESVIFSPDNKRLVSATSLTMYTNGARHEPELKVWDAETGQELFCFKGHGTVAWSPDGKRLASGSSDYKAVKVWDVQTGQELLTLKGFTEPSHFGWYSVAFSPDGKRLATGNHHCDEQARSLPSELKVWDATTGRGLLTLKGYTGGVSGVAFSPDSKRLISGSGGRDQEGKLIPGAVKVWDATTGRELLNLRGHTGSGVAFSPDGKYLTSAGEGEAKVWDAQTGRELLTFKGETSNGSFSGVAFSPDCKRVAAVVGKSAAPRIKVWDAQTGKEIYSLQGHTAPVSSLAFSPDSKCLASASKDRTLRMWDLHTGQETGALKGQASEGFSCVVFSPNGNRLASASMDGTLAVWRAAKDQEALTFKGPAGAVSGVSSPDGKRVAGGADDNSVKVLDAQTGQELLNLKGHTGKVTSVVFTVDGKRLASASVDGSVRVWDALTGRELLTVKEGKWVHCVACSPDSKRLASASADGSVRVWDAQTGQQLCSLKGQTDDVYSVVFSPDGKYLASASEDRTVKVWDAQTGQELQTCKGHGGIVGSVAYSPDGKRLASASWDKTVKLWDPHTGQELLTSKDAGISVAFSPDGHRLICGAADGTVRIWDASPLPE